MSLNDADFDKFRAENEDKLNAAALAAKQVMGDDAKTIDRLLSDKTRIKQLLRLVSKEDFEKFSAALDDPQLIKQVLASDKAKANLKRILGDGK